jgi:hypothetical protein
VGEGRGKCILRIFRRQKEEKKSAPNDEMGCYISFLPNTISVKTLEKKLNMLCLVILFKQTELQSGGSSQVNLL